MANGKIALPEDFADDATHYNTSGNWPEEFKIWAYQTVGYKFHGKSRWYSGWSTRTFCQVNNPSNCQSYWEQPSENIIKVDGPYDVRAIVYYNQFTDYSIEWVNY